LTHKIDQSKWDYPPHLPPPEFDTYSPFNSKGVRGFKSMKAIKNKTSKNQIEEGSNPGSQNSDRFSFMSNNPYVSICDPDDVDETEEEEFTNSSNQYDEDEDEYDDDDAGDVPTLHNISVRRLLLRVWSSKADLLAWLGSDCRTTKAWKEGSMYFAQAVTQMNTALQAADTEISKWFMYNIECNDQMFVMQSPSMKALSGHLDLVEDADIIAVGVQQLVRGRDRFIYSAERQKSILEKKLEPQWRSRDEAKKRLGDRWYRNPAPSNTHAIRRERLEKELKEICYALKQVQELDASGLLVSSGELHQRLFDNRDQVFSVPATGSHPEQDYHRYNGLRPIDTRDRVSILDYPDPTEFGWIFTGSNETYRVEYFECLTMKLDWYYTTATVKTSIGSTPVLETGKIISPAIYQQILEDPISRGS